MPQKMAVRTTSVSWQSGFDASKKIIKNDSNVLCVKDKIIH
jgi:hypothetical protein